MFLLTLPKVLEKIVGGVLRLTEILVKPVHKLKASSPIEPQYSLSINSEIFLQLKKADDAIELDTTALTVDQQVEFIVNKARQIIKNNPKNV